MSQKNDSENDIWEYKPLEKKKKRREPHPAPATATKRRCPPRKATKRDSASLKSPGRKVNTAGSGDSNTVVVNIDVDGHGSLQDHHLPSKSSPAHDTEQKDNGAEGPSSGEFCPMCQMPFSILVVQTQRWHVAECIDTPRDTCKGTVTHPPPYTSSEDINCSLTSVSLYICPHGILLHTFTTGYYYR